MISLHGKTDAIIYSDVPLDSAIAQIQQLIDQPFMTNTTVRIMPDYHAGKGCVIGTTIQLNDKVVPNLVGVDVGCGVMVSKIESDHISYEQLDRIIRTYVPAGHDVHSETATARAYQQFEARNFIAAGIQDAVTNVSLGTLGGGNHFIELAKGRDAYYLCVHTGSRSVGAKVAKWHQRRATELIRKGDRDALIAELKAAGHMQHIQAEIEKLSLQYPHVPTDLHYLEGQAFDDYMHDMRLAQQYAHFNRKLISETIAHHMGWSVREQFDTIHNYIDTESMTLRKGAVRALQGEQLIIPMNMRDGSLLCIGKGNKDWNESAPHGAGRLFSRTQAMKQLNMDDFKQSMAHIWTTSVTTDTLDEAPMAYKPMEHITAHIHETVDIVEQIQPVYNFKASEHGKPHWKK